MAHSLNNAKKSQFMRREASFSTRGSRTGANLLGWDLVEDMPEDQINTKIEQWETVKREIKKLEKSIHDKKSKLGWFSRPRDEIRKLETAKNVPPHIYSQVSLLKAETARLSKLQEESNFMAQKLGDFGYILGKPAIQRINNYSKEKYEYSVAFTYVAKQLMNKELGQKIHQQVMACLDRRNRIKD